MKLATTMTWMVRSTLLNKFVISFLFTLLLSVSAQANKYADPLQSYRSAYFIQDVDALISISQNISRLEMSSTDGADTEAFWYMFHHLISTNSLEAVWADMPVSAREFIPTIQPEVFSSADSFLFICNALFDAFQIQGYRGEAELVLSHCTLSLSDIGYISNEYYAGFLSRWLYMTGLRGDTAFASKIWDIFLILDTQGWYLDDEQSGLTLSLFSEALMFLDQYDLLLDLGKVAAIDDDYRLETVFVNNRRRVLIAVEAYAALQGRMFPGELVSAVSGADDSSWNMVFEAFIETIAAISRGESPNSETLSLVVSGMRTSGYSTLAAAIELTANRSGSFSQQLEAALTEQEEFKSQTFGQLSGSVSITLMDKLFYELIFRSIEAEFPNAITTEVSEMLVEHFAKTSFSQLDSFSRVETAFPDRTRAVSFIIEREQLFERLVTRLWLDVNRRYVFNEDQILASEELYSTTGYQILNSLHQSFVSPYPVIEAVDTDFNISAFQSSLGSSDGVWLIRYLDRRLLSCLVVVHSLDCSIRNVADMDHEAITDLARTLTALSPGQVVEAGRSIRAYFEGSVDFPTLKNLENLYIFSNDYAQVPWAIILNDQDNNLLFQETNVSILASMNLVPSSPQHLFDYEYLGVGNVSYRQIAELDSEVLAGFPTSTTRSVNLSPLPETEREIRTMAQNFEATDVRLYFGSDATYENIFGDYGENKVSARILHLATHAVGSDPDRGIGRPSLALAATAETEGLTSDIRLALSNVNAQTVILSACSTASDSSISNGAELVGLASSFIISGAQSVVASLWDINSNDTVEYMVEVSSALEREPSILDAMRVARNRMYERDPNSITSWGGFAHITRLSQ